MGFYIVKGNILEQKVDAIVVACAPNLKLDQGVLLKKIDEICGIKLRYEMKQLRNINISECVITNAYNLPCKKIIFAATPKWMNGNDNEDYYLRETYLSCLELANVFGLESIYFPLLATGANGMPKRRAIEIAISTIIDYVQDVDLNVGLVIYNKSTYDTYEDIFKKYEIKGNKASKITKEMLEEEKREIEWNKKWYTKGIAERIENGSKAKDFKSKLQYFMDQKGLSKLDCYNGVVSKTMFNNFLKKEAKPKKYTAIALGVNMGLGVVEINELLSTINESIDERIKKDLIISKMLHGKHNGIEEINEELVAYHYDALPTNDPSDF